jgi:hypothetical protein
MHCAAPPQLDTRRTSSTPSALAGRMNVMLSYLKSYENMGNAWIFCYSGCKCASQTINAHHTLRQSTVFLARLLPTEDADCVIGVKVLHNTTSGKHKFKVRPVTLMISAYVVALQKSAGALLLILRSTASGCTRP